MKWQRLLLVGLLPTCWLGMMLAHEGGHILAALVSGGTVLRLEWPLLGFSRADVSPNPHPLLVAWAGPLFGAIAPSLLSLVLRAARRRSLVADIVSGFCLLANGAYLGIGSLGRIGDTAEMLKRGSPFWILSTVGGLLMLAGLVQWHALGPRMGIRRIGPTEAAVAAALGAFLIAASVIWQMLVT